MEQEEPKRRGFGIYLKAVAALGIGFGMAAVWWEYSDKVIDRLLMVIGL